MLTVIALDLDLIGPELKETTKRVRELTVDDIKAQPEWAHASMSSLCNILETIIDSKVK